MMTVGDAVKRAEEEANRKLCGTEDLDLSNRKEIRRSRKRKMVESDTGSELVEINTVAEGLVSDWRWYPLSVTRCSPGRV